MTDSAIIIFDFIKITCRIQQRPQVSAEYSRLSLHIPLILKIFHRFSVNNEPLKAKRGMPSNLSISAPKTINNEVE